MFDDYTTIVSKAKYEPKLGKVLKILTLKQKIGQKYILWIEQGKLLKNIQQNYEFNKGIIQNGYYIHQF